MLCISGCESHCPALLTLAHGPVAGPRYVSDTAELLPRKPSTASDSASAHDSDGADPADTAVSRISSALASALRVESAFGTDGFSDAAAQNAEAATPDASALPSSRQRASWEDDRGLQGAPRGAHAGVHASGLPHSERPREREVLDTLRQPAAQRRGLETPVWRPVSLARSLDSPPGRIWGRARPPAHGPAAARGPGLHHGVRAEGRHAAPSPPVCAVAAEHCGGGGACLAPGLVQGLFRACSGPVSVCPSSEPCARALAGLRLAACGRSMAWPSPGVARHHACCAKG